MIGCPPILLCSPTLDVLLNGALLSKYLINSLGIEWDCE